MENNQNRQFGQPAGQQQIPQGPTKSCKHCKSIISKGAKVCPFCQKKQSGIGKWIVLAIVIILIIAAIGGGSSNDDKKNNSQPNTTTNSSKDINAPEKSESPKNETDIKDSNDNSDNSAEETNLTMGQKNALGKADDYLSISAFSYTGLIEQLEFEGFTTEEATFAADNCGADWNEQAAAKAQDYIDISSFSRDGLIEQLEFEGFSTDQAEYGVSAVGY